MNSREIRSGARGGIKRRHIEVVGFLQIAVGGRNRVVGVDIHLDKIGVLSEAPLLVAGRQMIRMERILSAGVSAEPQTTPAVDWDR